MKNNKGFTLVELLVVIAIIGILSTVAVVNLNEARDKAKVAAMQASVANIKKSFDVCISEEEDIYFNGSSLATGGMGGYQDILEGSQMCSNWNFVWPIIDDQDEYMTNYARYSGIWKLSFEIIINGVARVVCFEDAGCTFTEL